MLHIFGSRTKYCTTYKFKGSDNTHMILCKDRMKISRFIWELLEEGSYLSVAAGGAQCGRIWPIVQTSNPTLRICMRHQGSNGNASDIIVSCILI